MEPRYISGNVVTGKQLYKKLVKWKALVDTAGIKSADLKDKFARRANARNISF